MPNHALKPNPASCRSLADVDVERLRSRTDNLWMNPKKTCLTCCKQDKGGDATFRTLVDGQIVVYDCSCKDQWLLYLWLLNSGIKEHYQRLSWTDLTAVDLAAQAEVMTYADHGSAMIHAGLGLTLWSKGRGTGKSLLTTMLLKRLMADGHDGHFIQFNAMLDAFTAGWKSESERLWFIRRISDVGVLVIDDMGRESRGRENITEAMFDTVIRDRVASSKPTFLTTNYTPAELLQGYGHNVFSLLSERNLTVEVSGADYRPTVLVQARQNVIDQIVYPFVVS